MWARIGKYSFWLALLLHLLLFASVSVVFLTVNDTIPPKAPDLYIPAYTTSSDAGSTADIKQATKQQKAVVDKKIDPSAIAVTASREKQRTLAHFKPGAQQAITLPQTEEPVHLIGDEKVDKSLMVVLGKALSAHLSYPKIAIDFNLRGRALVGFTLYPDGHITDLQLVKSSGASVLDTAVLDAVNAMMPVKHVADYLHAPEYLVIGVIFG